MASTAPPALAGNRAKVDDAKRDSPAAADEPAVRSQFRHVRWHGRHRLRRRADQLTCLARDLRQSIRSRSRRVLRPSHDLVEIDVDPMLLQSYGSLCSISC